MRKNFIWPVTALVSVALIGYGAYAGLRQHKSARGVKSSAVHPADQSAGPKDETPVTVYVTRTDACYHKASCRYLLRRPRAPMDLNEAKQHYRRCSRCNPPG